MNRFKRPKNVRIIAPILLLPVLLAACGPKMSTGDYFKSLWWDVKMTQREAGEELITDPSRVWRKLRCNNRKLPYLKIEDNEVLPPQLVAGEKINHHLVYSLCPSAPSRVETARLSRSILYKGTVIFEDVTENYELKPGRWSVDVFITVAKQAEPGVYSLKLSLSNADLNIVTNAGFVVFERDEDETE